MNKKILFIITESDWGGAQRFLIEFLPRFIKLYPDIEITVAVGGKGHIIQTLAQNGCEVIHIKGLTAAHFSPIKDIKVFFKIITLFKNISPDLVFLISTKAGFYGSIGAFIYKILYRKKLKIIYQIGGFAFTERVNVIRKIVYTWIEKYTSWLKDYIVVNSQNNFDLAIEKRITSPHKLKCIYNGIDLNIFTKNLSPKENAKNFLVPKTNKQIIIGTIANFYRNKGLHILVQAAHQLLQRSPQLKDSLLFIIIGDGIEKNFIESKITLYGLTDIFCLTGAIPHAGKYLKAFDIFVLPSLKEGLPWTIMEAMAAPLPIIATDVGGNKEIITDGENGLIIPPQDPNALEQALLDLLSDKERRAYLAQRAQERVKDFSLESTIQQYNEIIFQALE